MKFIYALIITAFTVASQKDAQYYKPVIEDVEGWRIAVEPRLLEKENKDNLCATEASV